MVSPMLVLKAAGYKGLEEVDIGETEDGEQVIIGDWNHLGESWSIVRDYSQAEQDNERELTRRVTDILEYMGFPNQDDNKLIEQVMNDNSFKSPQACKVVNKDNQAADHIGIFTSSYGYTVRAVFSLEHAKLMELASSVLTPEEALECLRPF